MKHGAKSVAEPNQFFAVTCHPPPIKVVQSPRSTKTHEGWRDSAKLVTPPPTQTSVRSTSHILSSLTSSFSVTSSSLYQTAHPPLTSSPPVTHLGDRGMETASLRYQPHTRSFSNRFRLMREHLEAQVCRHLEEEGAEWGRVVVETHTCTHCTVQRAASSQLFVFCL